LLIDKVIQKAFETGIEYSSICNLICEELNKFENVSENSDLELYSATLNNIEKNYKSLEKIANEYPVVRETVKNIEDNIRTAHRKIKKNKKKNYLILNKL